MSDYLPEEVVVEILLRLPVKSFIKCSVVCTSWKSLVESSSFMDTHLTRRNDDTNLLLLKVGTRDEFGLLDLCLLHNPETGFRQKGCSIAMYCRCYWLVVDGSQPEVLEISLAGTLKIKSPITFSDCPNKPNHRQPPNLLPTPAWFSEKNKFISVSCGRVASLTFPGPRGNTMAAVCLSICDNAILGVASSPSLGKRPKPNCTSHCGSIDIPYPFGIEPGCYRDNNRYDRGYQILCDTSTDNPKPFLNLSDTNRPEVLNISLAGTLSPIFFSDCPNKPNYRQSPNLLPDIGITPFKLSEKNKFTSVSCGRIASLTKEENITMAVCLSICDEDSGILVNNTCGGINCCQTSLPFDTDDVLNTSFGPLINGSGSERSCKYAFLVDPEWFTLNSTNTSAIAEMDYVPILLDWRIYDRSGFGGVDNSTADNLNRNCESDEGPCSCAKGYEGNPYLRGGCQSKLLKDFLSGYTDCCK
ncbi:hypothetical protein ACLB2K_067147 [Fragaria x ananassa]